MLVDIVETPACPCAFRESAFRPAAEYIARKWHIERRQHFVVDVGGEKGVIITGAAACAVVQGNAEILLVIAAVVAGGEKPLFQIVGAVRLVNRLPRLLQRGQKQRNQNRNDGDNNKKLY